MTILTATDRAFPFQTSLSGIRVVRLDSPGRTRFVNRYDAAGRRDQSLLSRAAPIPEAALRDALGELPPRSAVLYAPVADELPGDGPLPRPPGAFVAAAPQGMLRRWDAGGRIRLRWGAGIASRLAGLDLVVLAEGELPAGTETLGRCLAVTRGRLGATLRRPGHPDLEVPAARAAEVDPTGAGDVFAAALAVSLWRRWPLERAAGVAAAAAALSVEAPGTSGIPTLAAALAGYPGGSRATG